MAFFSKALSRKPKCPKKALVNISAVSGWRTFRWIEPQMSPKHPVQWRRWFGPVQMWVTTEKKNQRKEKLRWKIDTKIETKYKWRLQHSLQDFCPLFSIKLDNNGFSIFRLLIMYYSPTLLVLLVAKLGKNMTSCRCIFAKMKTI